MGQARAKMDGEIGARGSEVEERRFLVHRHAEGVGLSDAERRREETTEVPLSILVKRMGMRGRDS